MKRKIISTLFALVLLIGLSLIPAVPAGADGPPPPPPQLAGISLNVGMWKTIGTSNGTALWSTSKKHSGSYSAELTTGPTDALGWATAGVPYGGTLTAFSTIAKADMVFWMYYTEAGKCPYAVLYLDTDADDVADLLLLNKGPGAGTIPLEPDKWLDTHPHPDAADWHVYDYDAAAGKISGGATLCDGNSYDVNTWKSLADWAALVCIGGGTFGDATVLSVAQMFGGVTDSKDHPVYIDAFIIDGVTYILEPMVLDAAYYKTGGPVGVAVLNSNASGTTPAIFAMSDTVGTGGAITIALSETGTGTGVFQGGFQLVNTTPGPGQLLVNNGDTIEVKYTGDWGAGDQELNWAAPPSATVDDTVPVITIVSPTVSENITEIMPLIKANYFDVGSAVDNATAVMKLDTITVTPQTCTPTTIEYTPSASANLSDGTHTVTVDVKDLAGNAAKTKSWSFTVDTVYPVITDTAADPTVILPDVKTEVTFSANVTDATSGVKTVKINLSPVGGAIALVMLDADADDIYTASENITESDEASYVLDIVAADYAGNSFTSNVTLGVWLDIVDPFITGPAIIYPFVGVDSAMPDDTVTISANVTDDVLMGIVTAACAELTATVTMNDDATAPDVTADDGIYTGEGTVKSDAPWGDYTITITAKDDSGNTATDKSLKLAVRSGATGVEIDLVEGWNLISLPLIPDSSNIMVVISADTLASENVSNVGIVYSYDPATGLFEYYMPATGSGDLTTMEDGYGYWVFMEEADTLTITGAQWPTPPAVPPVYSVVVGWNLIGFKSLVDLADTDYLISLHFYEDYDPYPVLWSYDAVAGAYENVKDGTMVVGHGFWLWMTETMVIVPPE